MRINVISHHISLPVGQVGQLLGAGRSDGVGEPDAGPRARTSRR